MRYIIVLMFLFSGCLAEPGEEDTARACELSNSCADTVSNSSTGSSPVGAVDMAIGFAKISQSGEHAVVQLTSGPCFDPRTYQWIAHPTDSSEQDLVTNARNVFDGGEDIDESNLDTEWCVGEYEGFFIVNVDDERPPQRLLGYLKATGVQVVNVEIPGTPSEASNSEDAAFKADSYVVSTTTGGIQITMIRQGVNGPYDPTTTDTMTADDVLVNVDGIMCQFVGSTSTGEYQGNFGSNAAWDAGETIRIQGPCSGDATPGSPFSSASEHRVQVTVRGAVAFDGKVVIN